MVARLLIGLGLALSAGCLKKLPAFACTEDTQCGAGGTCEINGLCSFSDAACASGRRFGAEQGELSNTCVGDPGPTTDGGVDAPTDMQTDCPNDLDCDNVVDGDDNCPTVANENQFNEDNDPRGDACDNCPPFDDNGQDADSDGLGDDCDPNPNGPVDTLIEFVGFREMPAGWSTTGTFALDTTGNGSLVLDGPGLATAMLMRPAPQVGHHTIWAEATLESISGGSLGAIGVSVLHETGTDQHGGLCQLVGLASGATEELRLFDTGGGNMLLDSVSHPFDPGARYELFLENDNKSLACDATNPDVGIIGTSEFAVVTPEVGLRVRSAVGRYHWVMVIGSD